MIVSYFKSVLYDKIVIRLYNISRFYSAIGEFR